MEGYIVCIMEIMSSVKGSSAEEDYVIALKLKHNILEADKLFVGIAAIENIAYELPALKVSGAHK